MALPLIWLGAGALGLLAANAYQKELLTKDRERQGYSPKKLSENELSRNAVGKYPSEYFDTEIKVKPVAGSIVCCTLAGVLEHTGIYIGDDTIIELHGDGLVKGVSKQRFIENRSGSKVFVSCDRQARPLFSDDIATRACTQIYQYHEYDLLKNNCHNFVWQCCAKQSATITTFNQLNKRLASYFKQRIYWDLWGD
jgi:hypothetical protein